jgi:hypothetical protein
MIKIFSRALPVSVFVLLLSALAVKADFYRYKDAHGVVRFTDSLANIPPALRKGATVYKSEAKADAEASSYSGTAAGAGKDGKKAANSKLPARMAALNKEMGELEKERQELQGERDELQKKRASAKTIEDQVAVNNEAKSYNERVKAYDDRCRAYEKNLNDLAGQNSNSGQ